MYTISQLRPSFIQRITHATVSEVRFTRISDNLQPLAAVSPCCHHIDRVYSRCLALRFALHETSHRHLTPLKATIPLFHYFRVSCSIEHRRAGPAQVPTTKYRASARRQQNVHALSNLGVTDPSYQRNGSQRHTVRIRMIWSRQSHPRRIFFRRSGRPCRRPQPPPRRWR